MSETVETIRLYLELLGYCIWWTRRIVYPWIVIGIWLNLLTNPFLAFGWLLANIVLVCIILTIHPDRKDRR